MGMFNIIVIECPHCDEEIEVQSKSGSCEMKRESVEDCDLDDLYTVANEDAECPHCGGKYVVTVYTDTYVQRKD